MGFHLQINTTGGIVTQIMSRTVEKARTTGWVCWKGTGRGQCLSKSNPEKFIRNQSWQATTVSPMFQPGREKSVRIHSGKATGEKSCTLTWPKKISHPEHNPETDVTDVFATAICDWEIKIQITFFIMHNGINPVCHVTTVSPLRVIHSLSCWHLSFQNCDSLTVKR